MHSVNDLVVAERRKCCAMASAFAQTSCREGINTPTTTMTDLVKRGETSWRRWTNECPLCSEGLVGGSSSLDQDLSLCSLCTWTLRLHHGATRTARYVNTKHVSMITTTTNTRAILGNFLPLDSMMYICPQIAQTFFAPL